MGTLIVVIRLSYCGWQWSSNSWYHFQLMVCIWRHGSHVGVQNTAVKCLLGVWLYYYAKLVGPFSVVLYTNMAVSSRGCKPRIGFLEAILAVVACSILKLDAPWAYTGLPVVLVTQKQKGLSWVVLNCIVPVKFFKSGSLRPFKDVRANCFCASLLRTQIHTPRHTRARALSNKMRDDRAKGHCYSFAWI